MPVRWLLFVAALLCVGRALLAQVSTPAESAQASIAYLRNAMDQYHSAFPVYDDVSSAGNHFHAYAKIPDQDAAVTINGSWTENPHSGATAIRAEFQATPTADFGGFYFQNGTLTGTQTAPQPNFGDVPNAGVDLRGATTLTFWARGAVGGERIEFFVGGVGRHAESGAATNPYPDSSPRRPQMGTTVTLTTTWQPFTIDLAGMDLSYVLGGFGWVASAALNPAGAVFFLDDIRFNLAPSRVAARLQEPRFIASFSMLPRQSDPFDAHPHDDIDFVLRNTAFTYDNALAVLAFLADGSADSVARARLIGDAFVYAMSHDRFFTDNRACGDTQPIDHVNGARLRTAYAAGDLALPPGWEPRGRAGAPASPGFYVDATQTFYEVEQSAIDTGNNAWAMLALTALYTATQHAPYLDASCRLGQFLATFRAQSGTYQGFLGGINDPEAPTPVARVYASTEHNLDLSAGFRRLFQLTGDSRWLQMSQHATAFVEAMWDSGRGCFLTGTLDPETRNASVIPLDVQAWSVQAVPALRNAYPTVLECADVNHRTAADGTEGFDFNDDRDGVWFEGTGQMALSYAMVGRQSDAEATRAELRRVQSVPGLGQGGGIAASSHDALTTGFEFRYFRRIHVGATAWNVFAQLGFNPFTATVVTPDKVRGLTLRVVP